VHAALTGFGLGFLVALQVGPMTLFLIRCGLRGGWSSAAAVAAGIAVVDGLYALAGAAGVTPLLAVAPLRFALGCAGALVLLVLGVRTLRDAWRVRLGAEMPVEVASPRRTFVTALGGTASNPLTIASWAAIFAAANASGAVARTTGSEGLLVFGVTVGSLAWGASLSTVVAVVRVRVGARALRAAEVVAGLGMVGFGGALGYETLHHQR
jgi:threonine/homoserine/homoserine lactone efflux protein